MDLLDVEALEDLTLDVDVLVNNAGLQIVNPIERFSTRDFRTITTLMLEVPFLLMRASIPGMYQRQFGRIVNISSVHGLRASRNKAAYVAAKHGLEGLSKVAAMEGGEHGVTSNCVSPGFVSTPLVQGQIADQARENDIPESDVVDEFVMTSSNL